MMGDRERREKIAIDFAQQGFLLSYTRVYGSESPSGENWVPILHDMDVGTATRYPPGTTKLEAAEQAWRSFSLE